MPTLNSVKPFKVLLVVIALCIATEWLFAQNDINTGRRKYYNIEALIDLIEKAREAGMSDEELKKLEIRDGDREINVWEYIEREKLARMKEDAMLRELLSKKFLTVNDIYNELIKTEPRVIKKLREELVSER